MSNRIKKIEKILEGLLTDINAGKLSREEIVVLLAQLLIRCGYSIHWGYESPTTECPSKIASNDAYELYFQNPTTGTTLMKLGFDLQEVLLLKKER